MSGAGPGRSRGPLGAGRLVATLIVLAALLLVALALAVAVGPSALGPGEVWDALRGRAADAPAADIVWRVRMPRAAMAAAVGAALAVAGVLFQALLRNPLADPYILGVSGGAALGGIAVIALGGAVGLGAAAVPPAAFLGALVAVGLLFAVVGPAGRLAPTALLLTGVVFNAVASAAIVFLATLVGFGQGGQIFVWLIGNLSGARSDLAGWVTLFLGLGLACAWPLARRLDLLALGEDAAAQLGVEVERTKRWLLLATSLMVGAAVAVSGLVGFVGLIVPHGLRLVLGPDHRLLVPSAALGGAAFLVVCDTAARALPGGRELPVGAITSLVGGPLFLWLLRRHHRQLTPA